MGKTFDTIGNLLLGVCAGLVVVISQAAATNIGRENDLFTIMGFSLLGLGIIIVVVLIVDYFIKPND